MFAILAKWAGRRGPSITVLENAKTSAARQRHLLSVSDDSSMARELTLVMMLVMMLVIMSVKC